MRGIKKLRTEVDESIARKAFELIRSTTDIFDDWSNREINSILSYMKILSYQKNTLLAKRGETVDYLGIVLSGSLLLKQYNRVYGFMSMGDMIGYMAWMSFLGCEEHSFNIRGEKEGYIAVLPFKSLKIMYKRDPNLMCSKYSLTIVYQQYEGITPGQELELEKTELTRNKIMDYLSACPNFGEFFNTLEKKNKRFIIANCEFVEYKSEQKLINKNSPVNKIVIVLKGEIMLYESMGKGKVYKSGDILGVKEMVYGLSWQSDAIGRQNGYLIIFKKDYLYDLCRTFAKAGRKILEFFINYEAKKIRKKYKHKSIAKKEETLLAGLGFEDSRHGSDKEESKTESQEEILNFLEFDVRRKNKELLKAIKKDKDKDILKPFKMNLTIPPLFSHKVFEVFMAPQEVNEEDIEMMNEDGKTGPGTFLKEKIQTQRIEDKKRKQELRMRKKKGLPIDDIYPIKKNKEVKNNALEALEIEYETLKNDYTLLEMAHNELNEEYDKKVNEVKTIKEEIARMKKDIISVTTERNKFKMHKELLTKDFTPGKNTFMKLVSNKNSSKNFNDVLKEQLEFGRKYAIVTRCAYKWLSETRKRMYEKIRGNHVEN